MMDQIQKEILNLLIKQSGTAMTADAIFKDLKKQNLPVSMGRTQEHIRTSIRSMINNHGQLIGSRSGGSANNGYFLITTRDELIETIMDLVSRSRSMLERVEALKNTWNNNNPVNKI